MTEFNKESFQKFDFTDPQIDKYLKSAIESLHIAETVKIPEVVFKFSYEALLKLCITVIARKGYLEFVQKTLKEVKFFLNE